MPVIQGLTRAVLEYRRLHFVQISTLFEVRSLAFEVIAVGP